MSIEISAEVVGFDELAAEFRSLPNAIRQKVLIGAMGTATAIVKNAVKAEAPEFTGPVSDGHPPPGTLKAAIYGARLARQCTAQSEVWFVGVRSGKAVQHKGSVSSAAGPTQGTNLDAFYARWVEYGHYTRAPKDIQGPRAVRKAWAVATGRVSWVPPNPFMRRGFDFSAKASLDAAQNYVDAHLQDALTAYRFVRKVA